MSDRSQEEEVVAHIMANIQEVPCVPLREPCWVWLRARNSWGYGNIRWNKKYHGVHRLMYLLTVGEIPAPLVPDHLCRVRNCANPSHLELVTEQVNILRGISVSARHAIKTHCPSGHPYDAGNTYVYRGSRYCKTCTRERDKGRVRSS